MFVLDNTKIAFKKMCVVEKKSKAYYMPDEYLRQAIMAFCSID